MKIEQIEELNKALEGIRKLRTYGWAIDNINLQYMTQGHINLRLVRVRRRNKSKKKEFKNKHNGQRR